MYSSAYFGVIMKYSVLESKYVKIIIAVHADPPAIRKVYPILSVKLQDLTD